MSAQNLENRIRSVLTGLGLSSVPESATESLMDYGLDSLMMVLAIAQFEKEFGVKIPGEKVEEENFSTIAKISAMLQEVGAK